MTIKKSDFLLNFLMFCLGATVGRRISDSYIMRHLAAKSADSMLMNLPHYFAIALEWVSRFLNLSGFINDSENNIQ
jgi:hypothetical protein